MKYLLPILLLVISLSMCLSSSNIQEPAGATPIYQVDCKFPPIHFGEVRQKVNSTDAETTELTTLWEISNRANQVFFTSNNWGDSWDVYRDSFGSVGPLNDGTVYAIGCRHGSGVGENVNYLYCDRESRYGDGPSSPVVLGRQLVNSQGVIQPKELVRISIIFDLGNVEELNNLVATGELKILNPVCQYDSSTFSFKNDDCAPPTEPGIYPTNELCNPPV